MSTDKGAGICTAILFDLDRAGAALAFFGAATFFGFGAATFLEGARFLTFFSGVSSVMQLSVVNNGDYTNAQFSTRALPTATRGRNGQLC